MTVSSIRGLAKEVRVYRQDAVVPASHVDHTRQRTFQAKLDVAGKQLQANSNDTRRKDASATQRHERAGRPVATRSAASPAQQPVNAQRALTREHFTAQRQTPAAAVLQQRLRRVRKSLPGRVRDKLFRLTEDLGAILADAWCDESQHSVTLIVRQPGFSETRFDVACDGTIWQVSIRADQQRDTDDLVANADALQERFSQIGLGAVSLNHRTVV